MYHFLLAAHSLVRWLVLITVLISMIRSYNGLRTGRVFTSADNRWRHWTAIVAHIQLMLGCYLYFVSPLIKLFYGKNTPKTIELTFFGMIHISMMLLAIVFITIGSAMAKRKDAPREKFATILRWYGAALLLIFIAIPWPFSPLAASPLLRPL